MVVLNSIKKKKMENKLFLFGIDVPLEGIVSLIYRTPEVETMVWRHFYVFEFNQDNGTYKMWNIFKPHIVFGFETENDMFDKMDAEGINFIGNIPIGNIFKSYTMAYLELVRWVADVYYAKRHWGSLIQE